MSRLSKLTQQQGTPILHAQSEKAPLALMRHLPRFIGIELHSEKQHSPPPLQFSTLVRKLILRCMCPRCPRIPYNSLHKPGPSRCWTVTPIRTGVPTTSGWHQVGEGCPTTWMHTSNWYAHYVRKEYCSKPKGIACCPAMLKKHSIA